ncbi:unnamed protein product [marine sediment metagenome]|uniref:Uncharacterized protein n=1 Tax=marine sediment metagenome TaxID=412755 RepID=X1U5A7_9ZZZZ
MVETWRVRISIVKDYETRSEANDGADVIMALDLPGWKFLEHSTSLEQ